MRRLIASTVVLYCSIVLLLAGCGENQDELAIKNGIVSMAKAVENHDADMFLLHIADDYRDNRGNDKKSIRSLLEYYFENNPEINLIISNMEIEFSEAGDTATVKVRVLATGGEGKLPERGRLNEITSNWRKQDDTWSVTRAKWRPVLLNLS